VFRIQKHHNVFFAIRAHVRTFSFYLSLLPPSKVQAGVTRLDSSIPSFFPFFEAPFSVFLKARPRNCFLEPRRISLFTSVNLSQALGYRLPEKDCFSVSRD